MRLIFIASTLSPDLGGIARSVPALACACAQAQATVTLIAPKSDPDTLGPIGGIADLDVRLCDGFSGVKEELNRLADDAESAPACIYHAGVWNSLNHFIARLGRRTGIPVIVSTRSMLDPWALNHRKWKKRLAWWLYARRDLLSATAIHATAELEAGYIRAALGAKCSPFAKATEDKPPVIVVPNGVNLPEDANFSRSHGAHGENPLYENKLRDLRGSVREKPRRLLFLSRIHEKKGVLDLVRAFGELNPEGWELVIAGNDDSGHQAVCEKVAKEQPNAERIRFHGAVADADKWELYASADLFVLPSYSENFGIVIGEALGCGVPVVTTTATPWGEYCRTLLRPEGFAGQARDKGLWIVEPGVYPLIGAMKEALALSDAERREMGARGAEWIRDQFTWESIGRQFLEEARKVLPEIR